MTRGEAIDLCTAIDQYMCAGNHTKNAEVIHTAMIMAIDALKTQLPEGDITVEEWIPVSERLPEERKHVLVTDWRGNIGIDKMIDHYDGKIPIWLHTYSEGNTAWMPLPEPYKEDEDG